MEIIKSPNAQRKLNVKNVLQKQGNTLLMRKPTTATPLKESFQKIITLHKLVGENGENQGELKISLELLTKKILLSKEIEQLEPEVVNQVVKIMNTYSFLLAKKNDNDVACNLLDSSLRLLQNSPFYENQQQQMANTLQNMGSIVAKLGQNTLAKKIFKNCLRRYYEIEVKDYQERYENTHKSIDKKDGQISNLPSQSLLNLPVNQKIQCGILLNNLSSIYLNEKKFEQALYLATANSQDFERLVFDQGEISETEDIKKDKELKQRVVILLNTYLNMGRAQENIGRLIKDIQDYSTKFLFFEQAMASYVNGCKLSKKYLGLEDRTFFAVFQGLFVKLRKEKEENFVKSFQSPHYIQYGQGYLDQTIEKRLLDFLNMTKKQQEDKMILTENNQYEQNQAMTERIKNIHIGKPKKQFDYGQSASFKEFKNSWFLQSNVPMKTSHTQRNIINSPSLQKQGFQNSFNSSQQIQNIQKANSFTNAKKQNYMNSTDQFISHQSTKGAIQTSTSQYGNQNDSNLNHQNSNQINSQRNINLNNFNIPQVNSQNYIQFNNPQTNNQNNSIYSNQDELPNFQASNNILNGTINNNINNTIPSKTLSQKQQSVPNPNSHRNSKPVVNGAQAASSGYSSFQSGQQIQDQSIQSPGVTIPLHLLQNNSSSSSPPMNQQMLIMNQHHSQSVQNPVETYFPNSSYSPIHQLQSAPSFSYNALPTIPSFPSQQQYSMNHQYFPQSQEHLLFLQHQHQSIQAANMQQLQGQQYQPQQFVNQNYYSDGNNPAFSAQQKNAIDHKLFEKNPLMDDQSDKAEDEHVQQLSSNQIQIKNIVPASKNENKKQNQTSEIPTSNKQQENNQIKKQKENESSETKNQKKKESEEINKYNELHNMINQQNEKIILLQKKLEQQRTNENIQYEPQSQEFKNQQAHNQASSNEKPNSLKNIQDQQEKSVKNANSSGQSQTNQNIANSNNNNNVGTLTSFDTSPLAVNGQKRGSKTDFKVNVNNEHGSQVVINVPKEQEVQQQHTSASSGQQANAQSSQDSNNNKTHHQVNKILEEDSNNTSISPNTRQTERTSIPNSNTQNQNQNSNQDSKLIFNGQQIAEQPQTNNNIYKQLEKKSQHPILKFRRSSKSFDNIVSIENNKTPIKQDSGKNEKLDNLEAEKSHSPPTSSRGLDDQVKRQPAKKKTLLQKHKSVNFQDENIENQQKPVEVTSEHFPAVEKRPKQNSVHSQTNTNLSTSPSKRMRYDLQHSQVNNAQRKIPNVEEMMRNGAKKAHAWKIIELSGEQYRINVDLNEYDITIWASNLKTNQQIAKQLITLSNLQQLLDYVEYEDVLPNSKPLKSISTTEDILSHFILPFLTINDGQVSLQPKAVGLVDQDWSLNFLNTQCYVSFHHIIGNQFRLIFTCVQRKDQFKVDLEVDDQIKADFFENMDDGNKYLEKYKDIINLSKKKKNVLDLSDDEISSLKIASSQTLKPKSSPNKNKADEEEDEGEANEQSPPNFKNLNQKDFNKFIDKYDKRSIELVTIESLKIKQLIKLTQIFIREIENIENFLQKDLTIKDINLFNLRFNNKILKLNMFNDEVKKQIKGRIVYVYEDQAKQVFCIKMKNTYETFAPKDTKEQAKGHAELKFIDIWKEYGVQYDTLDASDKICICNFISKQYYLYQFDKKLDEEDDGRYNPNAIKKKNFTVGLYQRILIGPKFYKQVVTMTYLGIEDEPLGIKVTIYDPLRCEEKGLLITLEDKFYKKTQAEMDQLNVNSNGQKKRTKKFKDSYTINSNFHIHDILKAFGWKILLEIIQVLQDKINRIYSIKGPNMGDKNSSVYRFEAIVNPSQLIKFFQTKNMNLFQSPN